jgi:ubiquinone/menaquinone biosynthesis C-methylase UbiE
MKFLRLIQEYSRIKQMNNNIWQDRRAFREWNEKMSRIYDPDKFHNHHNFFIRWIEKRRRDLVLKFLQTESHHTVLDVGCGAGNVLAGIGNCNIVGIDLSEYLLLKCRERLNGRGYLGIADAQCLPFKDSSFDRVICSEVIEHVVAPTLLLSEIARVMKKDGIVIFTIPNESRIVILRRLIYFTGLSKIFFKNRNELAEDGSDDINEWHLHYFDRANFKYMLSRYFYSIKIKSVPFQMLPIHWVFVAGVKKQ